MSKETDETIKRKKDHIKLCLNDNVGFMHKTTGLEDYQFEHYAITEVTLREIDLSTKLFNRKIAYPFLISCMTGGTEEANNLNADLAIVAAQLNIPIGVGSQRQALENTIHHESYKVVRKNAPNVPVLGNIGAAQVVQMKDSVSAVQSLVDLIEADAMVIHINPLQELIQKNGEPNFKGLLKVIELLSKKLAAPIIAKEVGAGISKSAAQKLLDAGVGGIDVAGAGGTSWSAVELIRNGEENEFFHDWGVPTAKCIEDVALLKSKYNFTLIASGGLQTGEDIAKSLALGADIAASARPLLVKLVDSGIDGVINLIIDWFDTVKKIMYLTGSKNLTDLNNSKIYKTR